MSDVVNQPAATEAPTAQAPGKVMLECHQLSRVYDEGPADLVVLDQLELKVHAGERVAVVGSSGSGKTTLLNLLGGLDSPSAGEVRVDGTVLHQLGDAEIGRFRNRHIGFVYQFHHLLAEFSALENVALPLIIRGSRKRDAEDKARALLQKVGLGPRADHKPGELSGGERQRAAIARALVTDPSLMLMDEPTGNLDKHTAASILALMDELAASARCAFVIVTHDPELAAHQDRVLRLDNGRLQPD
ncbi:ATP-binding cassette domain-containing protein [Halomonas denitrificans]|uniref:ABC transporter ATP-binding protein n=1 Tax=Halomonas TaxID=2745 RepID=UPI001A8E14EF|nr:MULTISPECIES: ATP-binding cassette domain-containing protein [Halomonas]MED5296795.1 ATP-binding cassette domain-containing protein [Pseudomonadota bacterium]MBN8410829.1 ATP-binding cassette domain-containing protein [Halomonas litopenaei]MBY5925585.1 ATP-binding cassette domain-containing protein [Halomonas sp. DP4Y7-2]MBY5930567.1 ATP-binding cassette domain-containing protein [Halomonas sp. DP8Y7-3]MBY5969377.1 ATP-binding cassette domain-containing protein [Halomonas denitrificans]